MQMVLSLTCLRVNGKCSINSDLCYLSEVTAKTTKWNSITEPWQAPTDHHRWSVYLRGRGARPGRRVDRRSAVRLLRVRPGGVCADEPHRVSTVPHQHLHGTLHPRPVLPRTRLSSKWVLQCCVERRNDKVQADAANYWHQCKRSTS